MNTAQTLQIPASTQTTQTPHQPTEDPFRSIFGCVDAASLVSSVKLKLAIVGKPKTGKSWLAATAPKPLLVYDFDQRAESLRGKAGVMIKTLVDLNQQAPTAMQQVENDLALLKADKAAGRPIPATYVFDSVMYMKKAMENSLMASEDALRRTIKLTPQKVLRIGKGWDIVNAVRGYAEYIVNEFSQLGHVIFVFHERDEKDTDRSTAEKTAYTGKLTVDPQYLATVLSTFNEVWRIDIDYAGKYQVQTKSDNIFGGSTTLEIDAVEVPSIELILAKHKAKIEAGSTKR